MTFHYPIALYIFHISNKILLGGGEKEKEKNRTLKKPNHIPVF